MAEPAVSIKRIEFGATRWEIATLAVPLSLQPFVQSVMGFEEWGPGPNVQMQTPRLGLTLMLDLNAPLALRDAGGGKERRHRDGFVAGLYDGHVATRSDGRERGLQIDLTLAGGRRLLGLPLSELKNTSAAFDEVVPRHLRGLTARLRDLPNWPTRLHHVCALLQAELTEGEALHPAVAYALARFTRCQARPRLSDLARETGYSEKHLTALFHTDAGLPPGMVSRIARFQSLCDALRMGRPQSWANLAAEYGYADQAHLSREVKRFSGRTPTALRRELGAFSEVINVQEPDVALL